MYERLLMNRTTRGVFAGVIALGLIPLITSTTVEDVAEKAVVSLITKDTSPPMFHEDSDSGGDTPAMAPLNQAQTKTVQFTGSVNPNTVLLQKLDDSLGVWEDISSAPVGAVGANGAEVHIPSVSQPESVTYRFRAPLTEDHDSVTSDSFTIEYASAD